jgi:arginase
MIPSDHPQPNHISIIGVPFDRQSSYLRGPALAPARIRESLVCESANMWTENGIDLAAAGWQDVGDVPFSDDKKAFEAIETSVADLLEKKQRVISLGGDHSIAYPIMRAYAKAYANLTILQLDAHPDLYEELDGNRHSHACPFARIMEEKLAARLVQVGIRTLTGHQREQAQRFGVEVHEMCAGPLPELNLTGPVYLSLDMDCLDPAFAPGVSHFEPGGMSTREVLSIIQGLKGHLVGADLVEYNPQRDPNGMTGMVAAKLLKEILGRMLANEPMGG